MSEPRAKAKRVLVTGYLIILHGVLLWLLADKFLPGFLGSQNIAADSVSQPATLPHAPPASIPPDSTTPEPSVEPTPSPTVAGSPPAPSSSYNALIIPVQGISVGQLTDTYSAARSDGRTHEAIDIMAPGGTPVVAAADGEIVKFFDSKAGGITIYQITPDQRHFLYYAHLQKRADGLSERQFVSRGTLIGYVGDTGNAGTGNFHLHFAIYQVRDPKRYWDGVPINPYPILAGSTTLP